MKADKKVSILIPVYNVSQYLSQCLESIVNQTYKNLQVVLVDDGSSDDSFEICKDYASRYIYIEAYTKRNEGVASARNLLLSHVKGDFVLFVDSDDWLELDAVEFAVDNMLKYNADVVIFQMLQNNKSPRKAPYIINMWNQDMAVKEFLRHKQMNGSLCNKLIKANLFGDKHFNNAISYGEDAVMTWTIIQDVNIVVNTNKELYHYRWNDNSLTHQSFVGKRLSSHISWNIITEDVERSFPTYVHLARAQWGRQNVFLLIDAAFKGVAINNKLRVIQKSVRENLIFMMKSDFVTLRLFAAACFLAISYNTAKFFFPVIRKMKH